MGATGDPCGMPVSTSWAFPSIPSNTNRTLLMELCTDLKVMTARCRNVRTAVESLVSDIFGHVAYARLIKYSFDCNLSVDCCNQL